MFQADSVSYVFDLSRTFLKRVLTPQGARRLRAVDDVSFAIARGRTMSLVGESGCGKSTMARMAVGVYRPTAGEIRYDGQAILPGQGGYRRQVNMVFQDPYASLDPRWKVEDIIAEPMRTLGIMPNRRAVRDRVRELLEQVGLSPNDGDRYPHEFSGGQRQRISIARALSGDPSFLVCDEPTSALDVSVQAQILNLMKGLQQRLGLTMLFISHNLSIVRHMSDRVGVMYLGRLVEIGESEELFRSPRHPYTRMLLAAIPDPRKVGGSRRAASIGEVPNPLAPPSGCAFHPRCPLATDRCRSEKPAHRERDGTLVACHEA
jgi:peptide/nickel transport system ATP-binding protein